LEEGENNKRVCVKRGEVNFSDFEYMGGVFYGFAADEPPVSKVFFALEDTECLIENAYNKKVDRGLSDMWNVPYSCDHETDLFQDMRLNHLQEVRNFNFSEYEVLKQASIFEKHWSNLHHETTLDPDTIMRHADFKK
jgi:hypothetical protein